MKYSKRNPDGTIKARTLDESYVVDPHTGCWEWVGTLTRDGYGSKGLNGTSTTAQRWVYEQVLGGIPDGLHLDHLCRNRSCVNPQHMEPVTCAENNRRRPRYERNTLKAWQTKRETLKYSSTIAGVSRSGRGWQARVPNGNGKPFVSVGTSVLEEGAGYCLRLFRKEVPLAPF